MPRTVFRLRRAGLICIGALCLVAGLGLVYALVRPGVLGRTSTLQLALVAGLLVWPGLTYVLLRVDNVSIRRGRSVRLSKAKTYKIDEPEDRSRSAA
ncbi:MAG: hypothetical protein ACI89L_002145 [Phycisphaerales bacterium]|jgi:hypothetical protein